MPKQGDVKFSGTRNDFVACGLMNELDTEETNMKSKEAAARAETPIEEKEKASPLKPAHKSIASLSGVIPSEPESETSSLAPEDEATVTGSDSELKKKRVPRKLIEDEKRARGRIAWPVWRTYFTVSSLAHHHFLELGLTTRHSKALGGPFWCTCINGSGCIKSDRSRRVLFRYCLGHGYVCACGRKGLVRVSIYL